MPVFTDLQTQLVLAFLVTSMVSVGLRSGVAELRAALRERGFLAKALLANFLLVPLLGLALVRLFPLPPATATALVLLSCVPGGLSAIRFTKHVEGQLGTSEALFAILNLAAVLVSPWIVDLALPAVAGMHFPHGRALAFVVVAIVAPLVVGVILHDRSPVSAPRLAKVLGYASLVAFVAFSLQIKSFRQEAVQSLGLPAMGVVVLFILASMAIGWLLGGPDRGTRQVLASATSLRNAAVCLVIAKNSPLGAATLTPLVAISFLMLLPHTLTRLALVIWNRIGGGRESSARR